MFLFQIINKGYYTEHNSKNGNCFKCNLNENTIDYFDS